MITLTLQPCDKALLRHLASLIFSDESMGICVESITTHMQSKNGVIGQQSFIHLVELFFRDNRTFKIPVDSTGATLYGAEQLAWLDTAYTSSSAKIKIVLMGGQFLNSAQTFENVSIYPEERQRLIDLLSNSSGIPVVLTGDRHHGEISKLITDNGKSIYDATASPLTAKSFPHHEENNIYRTHVNTTETNHFGLMRVNFKNNLPKTIDIKLIGEQNEVLFSLRETL